MLPEPPKFADSLSAGLHCWISEASAQCGLVEDLAASFGEDAATLILDLCSHMLSRESAVMQHVPSWARDHVLFSEDVPDDTYLGRFLKSSLSIPKIALFREKWAVRNIGDGKIYLCYDSTNVNSQANVVCPDAVKPSTRSGRNGKSWMPSLLLLKEREKLRACMFM